MSSIKNKLGISDLIQKVKQDLLSEQSKTDPELFSIDEIVLEINFTISGDIDGGFNLGVVTLGSQVSEERVQKVTIKLTPIVSKSQMIEELNKSSNGAKETLKVSASSLMRNGKE